MSENDDTKETAMVQPSEVIEIPPQQSATDTSNWDNKISTDPDGEKYIRTQEEASE